MRFGATEVAVLLAIVAVPVAVVAIQLTGGIPFGTWVTMAGLAVTIGTIIWTNGKQAQRSEANNTLLIDIQQEVRTQTTDLGEMRQEILGIDGKSGLRADVSRLGRSNSIRRLEVREIRHNVRDFMQTSRGVAGFERIEYKEENIPPEDL